MNDQMQDLARRAVACKHWRWMPGMLWIIPAQPGWVGDNKGRVLAACEDGGPVSEPALVIPDLTDPATLGCLLALVREAWNDPGIACVTSSYSNGQYYRRVVDGHHHGSTFQTMSQATHLTEAEALIAALEAAP